MGRSTTSCFKIIACGRESVDKHDLEDAESKASTKRRGWSFRKRSARHRVLSNTVVSEVPSSVTKESLEHANINFQTQAKPAIQYKSSGVQWADEMPQLSTSMNSKFSESKAVAEVNTKFDVNPDESVIVVIQAAIRRSLAERELLKHKKIVKLQAAVRGHLIRRHAVGSLRCVKAIIKMQALVRARRARLFAEGSTFEEKLDQKPGNYPASNLPEKQKSGPKPDLKYLSIEKLLNNRFARQLTESSPRTKSINIKCDTSRNDSAWQWLARWTVVSPVGTEQAHKPQPCKELDSEIYELPENQVKTVLPAEDRYESTDLKFSERVASVPHFKPGSEDAALPYSKPDSKEAAVPYSDSNAEEYLVSQSLDQPQPEKFDLSKPAKKSDVLLYQNRQADTIFQTEVNSLSGKPELEADKFKPSMKRVAPEEQETAGRKLVLESRKAGNPAFIAAQSKFEELTSTTNSEKSISSSNKEIDVEPCKATNSSVADSTTRTREINLADNSVTHTSRVLVGGGSECGTELSILSILDIPDQSEVGAVKFEQTINISKEETGDAKNTTYIDDIEAKVKPSVPGSDLSYPTTIQQEEHDDRSGAFDEPFESAICVDSSKVVRKLQENPADVQIDLEHETVHQVYKSSPEASPRSHVTVHEAQGTPTSQVSTKEKTTNRDKNSLNQKRKSLPAGKRSPVIATPDSGVRSSQKLPKDHENGKRRNSFGSSRSDHVDLEPKDSSGGHSLPSYMQATESARAKAHTNSSPRSSPDVQDKEIYIKKRHSLPGANGRQGSPNIERSISQAQQITKGNGTNAPHERKWQR